MGFLKKGGVVLICIILLLSFIIGNALFTVSSSLKYDNVQKNFNPILKEIVYDDFNGSEIEDNFGFLHDFCEKNPNQNYLIEHEIYNVSIPCSDVLEGNQQTFIDKQINDFIEEIYYAEYNCGFFDCFKGNSVPFFLLSEKSKDYLSGKFYWSIFISIILAVLIFFLLENKDNLWILLGSLLIISAIPFFKISSFTFGNSTFAKIYSVFLGSSHKIFIICLVLGVLLLAIGVLLKFWSFEEIVSLFRKKDNLSISKPKK